MNNIKYNVERRLLLLWCVKMSISLRGQRYAQVHVVCNRVQFVLNATFAVILQRLLPLLLPVLLHASAVCVGNLAKKTPIQSKTLIKARHLLEFCWIVTAITAMFLSINRKLYQKYGIESGHTVRYICVIITKKITEISLKSNKFKLHHIR